MDAENSRYLKKFYDQLYDSILKEKKTHIVSVFFSLLKMSANKRYMVLEKSTISTSNIPSQTIKYLLDDGFIRQSEVIDSYVITAKGVWEHEKINGTMSENVIIDFLDNELFTVYESGKPLTEREKVVLFAMIAARAFSEASSIDLQHDDEITNGWKTIIDKTALKLKELNIISENDSIYGHGGTELAVSRLIRHTDKLPRKSKGIFRTSSSRSQKYYLDLYKNSQLSKEKLTFLFQLVFEKKLSFELLDDITKFCQGVAYNDVIYVYDVRTHIFSNPQYDDVIRDALREAIISTSTTDE